METTSLIALSGQSSLARQMDIVANNIANMNTHGFKNEKVMFVEHLVKSQGGDKIRPAKLSYVRDIATMTDMSPGQMEKTGNPFDLAITNEGFFVIQTKDGERYTRNGRFQLDDGGQIVTQTGDPLVSSGGAPFFLSPEDTEVTISRDGTVATNNGELGKIRLVTFENPQSLERFANGLFASKVAPTDVENPEISQGTLEGSNIKPILEMAKLIEVSRKYDSVRKFITREDERMRNMIKEMGTA
ncbi:MAG: flagellar basal-body rod protein FlgF [Rhodospirillales bacterium]|nr:flagellar basal-body rod protein FlgF [Rhodospirillales bacterium]